MNWLDWAHRARRLVLGTLRWRTRGVRVLVFDRDGRLLLIRHGYGDRATWYPPGGGLRWRETPERGARREVREEVGCGLGRLEPLGTYLNTGEGWRDTVFLFRGVTDDAPRVDAREVVEARFFALDRLPSGTSPATLRRLAELAGAPPSAAW